jgi:hypothetical protein
VIGTGWISLPRCYPVPVRCPAVSSAREVGELSPVAGGFPVVPIVGGLVIVAVVALIVWAIRASAKPK